MKDTPPNFNIDVYALQEIIDDARNGRLIHAETPDYPAKK